MYFMDKIENYESPVAFVKDFNQFRLAHKGKWVLFVGTVDKQKVEIKSFGTTYLQIFRINGIEQCASMELSIKGWKNFLRNQITLSRIEATQTRIKISN